MSFKLGIDAKLYRNTGSHAAPSWNEVSNVRDVTLNLEAAEADVTTRANAGWRATVASLRDASVEFEMVWDTADEDFNAFRDAYLNGTTIEVAVLDGDLETSGTQGLRATVAVMSFSRSEPLEEGVTLSVTIKPTYADNAPEWMEVT